MPSVNPAAVGPEVELVHAVHSCRQCDWLWQAPRLYGPFPQCGSQALPNAANVVSKVIPIVAFDLPAPAVLRGCRKAPVMIVGINPNLTGHFTLPRRENEPLPKGARAVYPRFSSVNDYAQHYRFIQRDVHEYQMGETQVEDLVELRVPSLKASWPGKVLPAPTTPTANDTRRDETQRAAWLSLDRDNDEELALEPRTWGVQENHVVIRPKFDVDTLIAGVMTQSSTVGKSLDVSASRGSYYATAQKMADAAQLDLGEDVSMHDMLACATPSWKADQMKELRTQCVNKNGYTARQIRHSQPGLMLFSGSAAFEMFRHTFGEFIVETVDSDVVNNAVNPFKNPNYIGPGYSTTFTLRMPAEDGASAWEATLLVLSHLSYSVDQKTPPKISTPGWQAFAQKHPQVWALMTDADGQGTGEASQLSPQQWRPFLDGLHDEARLDLEKELPDSRVEAVAALVQRLKAEGRLRPNTTTAPPTGQTRIGGLLRDAQNCSYCTSFSVAGGCLYTGVQPG